MSAPSFRNDPIFRIWNVVEAACHRRVKSAHPKLRSYFIDAIPESEIRLIQNSNYIAITNSIIDSSICSSEFISRVCDSFYGVYYYPYSTAYYMPSKDFDCFMNRMDPFRQSWLYQLVRLGLFDRGYISFNIDTTKVPHQTGMTQSEVFEQQFQQHCSIFTQEHNKIKNLVPYKNFTDNGDITNVVLDSKFSIVLETYFNNNQIVTYSEKIFRCLQLPRPWVLFASQHAVKHLRNMGFDLLDDVVDHSSYDQLESAVERQVKILGIVQSLILLDIDNLQERLIKAAEHNQKMLKHFSTLWEEDLDNTIKIALQKIHA
jgi:hypothetical protein